MHRQRKFAESVGGFYIDLAEGHSLGDLAETNIERGCFLEVSELSQQAQDFIGELARLFDFAQCGDRFDFAGMYILEKEAIEVAAIFGAFVVDSAAAAFQGSARLREVRSADCGAGSGDRKVKRAEPGGAVATLELYIGEDHAVAAHAALEAE